MVGTSSRLQRHALLGQCGTGDDRPGLRRQRRRHLPWTFRRSGFDRPGRAARHQPVHRALRARHLRRDAGILDHRRRPFQCRQYQPAGSDRHRAEWQRYLYTLQSDHRRHLQDHAGIDGLCRLFGGEPRADAAGTGMRRSRASLHHCLVPCLRSAVEAGGVPYRGSRIARHPGTPIRHARLEARRIPRRQYRRHPRHSQPGLAGLRLFPERRLDPPPGHRGRSHSEVEQHCSSTPAIPLWTRASWTRCRSAPTARLPMPTAISRFCRATKSRRFRATAIKAGFDYAVTDAFKFGGDALFIGSQYFVGDESNQSQKLPGYAVFNLHASYQIDKNFQIYARADNIFDNRYATYGTFFDTAAVPNFANGGAPFTDPRSLSPARPRAFYAGMKSRSEVGGSTRVSPPGCCGEPGSRGRDRRRGSRRTETPRCSRERRPAKSS